MRLDRNINQNGEGKYALINLRKVVGLKMLERDYAQVAMKRLSALGVLTYGSESPSDQFFVIKYGDCFAAPALRAYARAVLNEAECREVHGGENEDVKSLREFSLDIESEADASDKIQPKRIPT